MAEKWQFSPSRLLGHRKRLKLTRQELAQLVGRTAGAIKSYEQGFALPSVETYLSLAASLGISPNDLAVSDPTIPPETQLLQGYHWPMPPPATIPPHPPPGKTTT